MRTEQQPTSASATGADRLGSYNPAVPKEPATPLHHPVRRIDAAVRPLEPGRGAVKFKVPATQENVEVEVSGRAVKLTNLSKPFWPELGLTKRDLIQYYADVAHVLLPHLRDRAMVMKRYPNGAGGPFFFMKRCPKPRPDWLDLCEIEHTSGNVIDFPMIQDLPALLWVINLGCIDLNEWYARCDDVDRPDYLHFDLDPGPEATYEQVVDATLLVHEALVALGMPSYVKTTGSRGFHVYVPIVRGPDQRQVWTFAKAFAQTLEGRHGKVVTAVYKIAKRPKDRVLVDYNQNAWGRTLASVYSVRPRPQASVSTPVDWKDVEDRISIEAFTIGNVPDRVKKLGDLWEPVCYTAKGRFKLESLL
jgi:bifunctional non-homologous end joining protein LigD